MAEEEEEEEGEEGGRSSNGSSSPRDVFADISYPSDILPNASSVGWMSGGSSVNAEGPEQVLTPSRRRSSITVAPLLAAINELDEPEEALHFDLVCLGGGLTAGWWADALVANSNFQSLGLQACIISSYISGMAPHEKAGLIGDLSFLDHQAGKNSSSLTPEELARLPFVQGHGPDWYEKNGITMLSSCQAIRADLGDGEQGSTGSIVLKHVQYLESGGFRYQGTCRIYFDRLLIATGARSERIADTTRQQPIRGIQAACFCTSHSVLEDRQSQFVHYLRDVGGWKRLCTTLARRDDGVAAAETHPVVVIGRPLSRFFRGDGSPFIALQVAATIASIFPQRPVVLLLESPREIKPTPIRLPLAICDYYMQAAKKCGVRIISGFTVMSYTMDHGGHLPVVQVEEAELRKVAASHQEHLLKSSLERGLVLQEESGETQRVWLPAHCVIAGLSELPNSELFRGHLDLACDSSLLTDSALRTSHASGKVYAAGDCACFPLLLDGGAPSRVCWESVAASAARHVAVTMLAEKDQEQPPFNPVPHVSMSSPALGCSWVFCGLMQGTAVIVYEKQKSQPPFAVLWLQEESGCLVGAFIDGAGERGKLAAMAIASDRPMVGSVSQVKDMRLPEILRFAAAPAISTGEAALDDKQKLMEVFMKYEEGRGHSVATARLAQIMRVSASTFSRTRRFSIQFLTCVRTVLPTSHRT
jgi:hypothetical protein